MSSVSSVDIGIITITNKEYESVFKRLIDSHVQKGRESAYRISTLKNGNTVALTRCIDQGNIEAQATAQNMIDDLNPKWIFVVGIAGGVPCSEFSLGDVIVSSYIYDLTVEEVTEKGRTFDIKGGWLHDKAKMIVQDIPALVLSELSNWSSSVEDRPPLDLSKIKEFMKGDEIWNKKIDKSLNDNFCKNRRPLTMPGKIAASDKLIKDFSIVTEWQTVARKILAIEMESAGVYRAARKYPVLAIRGISDIIGFEREEIWTQYACETAAAFVISLAEADILIQIQQEFAEENKVQSSATKVGFYQPNWNVRTVYQSPGDIYVNNTFSEAQEKGVTEDSQND